MNERISHWLHRVLPDFDERWHSGNWYLSWGPLTIYCEKRYYRSTGYFLVWANDWHQCKRKSDRLWLYTRWGIPYGFEWRFKDYTPTEEENRELDKANWLAHLPETKLLIAKKALEWLAIEVNSFHAKKALKEIRELEEQEAAA